MTPYPFRQAFFYMFFFVLFFSCSAPVNKHEKMDKLKWLIGNWEINTPEGNYYESWKVINDSVYSGASYFISGKDTLSAETVSLEEREGELLYIPMVRDQNEGKPVTFRLTSSAEETYIFENPGHDFPQKISYRQLSADSLLAEVSGLVKGSERKEEFPMKRSK